MNIGIIGLGDMGSLCARQWASKGYQVIASDLPERFEELEARFHGTGITVYRDSKFVAKKADFLLYSVEAINISRVVEQTAPYIRPRTIVSGQTSVKHPEIEAFEAHLPSSVYICTCHSLHGPAFSTVGQKLAVVPHRIPADVYIKAMQVYEALGSDIIEMESYTAHDMIMADTQAVTHMGFESMGTAWTNAGFYPWDNGAYSTGIDNVKILTTLRIFSYKAHIYAGLALMNPLAQKQVRQYAQSESELFKMMICEQENEFKKRIHSAAQFVFHGDHDFITLDDDVMSEFKLIDGPSYYRPNSHLSILAMVDAWSKLGVNPYHNMVCQTPPFKLRLGIAEYLFKDEALLNETIETALYDKSIRADDLEFHSAVREWASIIGYGDMNGYLTHFQQVKDFFADRLEYGANQSKILIDKLNT